MTNSLPPQGPRETDDQMAGEAELRALYGKLPQNEPGAALDATVLRAAADAMSSERDASRVEGPTNKTVRKRAPRWLIGLSSAATLVLAAGLAWHVRSMPQADSVRPTSEDATTNPVSNAAGEAAGTIAPAAMLAPATMPPPPPTPLKQPPRQSVTDAARLRQSMKGVAERTKVEAARKQAQADMSRTPSVVATRALGQVEPSSAPAATQVRSAADKAAAPPQRFPPQAKAIPAIRPPISTPELSPSVPPAPPAPPAQTQAAAAAVLVDAQVEESKMQDASAAQNAELDAIRELFVKHHDEEALRRLDAFSHLYPQQSLPPDLQVRLRKP